MKSFTKLAKDVSNTLKMSMAATLKMPDIAPAGVSKIEVAGTDMKKFGVRASLALPSKKCISPVRIECGGSLPSLLGGRIDYWLRC